MTWSGTYLRRPCQSNRAMSPSSSIGTLLPVLSRISGVNASVIEFVADRCRLAQPEPGRPEADIVAFGQQAGGGSG